MNINYKEINNALIICPNNYKDRILESFNTEKIIADVNFMNIEDYKKNYLFDYDVSAINYLTKDGLTPENAKEILNNIYYVEDKSYNNQKLDKLVEYKKKLQNKGFLITNDIFKQYIKTKNVYVLGYGELSEHDKSLICGKQVNIIEDEIIDKKYTINTFNDISEEVEFVYNSIYDLLEKGIDINHIYVMNAGSDYSAYLKRFNSYYKFSIETKDESYIVGTTLAQEFLEMLETHTKEEIYNYLSEKNNEIANKLINILNKYVEFDLKEIKDLIVNDVKKTKIKNKYTNIVKNANLFDCFKKDDYIFLMGFNDNISLFSKDVDYITDNIKPLVNLETTEETNKRNKNNFIKYISNIENLVISYSKNSPFNQYNKQFILNDENCDYKHSNGSYDYSNELNKAKYTQKLDTLRKFDSIEEGTDKLNNLYGKNNYLSYNNKFKGLSDIQIENIINQINLNKKNKKDKLSLSYSTMNSFFECNFKYYLDTVLMLKEPFGNYYTKLGTVCHGVLKDLYNDKSFDFEKSWNNQIELEEKKENANIFEDESEKYFVSRIKEELRNDINIVRKQKQESLLNETMCERYFEHEVTDKINFIGFIDKLMFKKTNNETLASVVDYKTSRSIEIDKDIMKYGLSLQLPSYLYLIKHSKDFDKEVRFAGLYIQHLINYNRNYIDEDSSLSKSKNDSMKLDGISSIDPDRMKSLDLTLQASNKSENIKGISINKDGSLKKSQKLYSDEQFEELSNIVENSIKTAGEAILKGDFTINPKEIDGENKSCGYCKYAEICYKRNSDLKYIFTKEEQ